ncbi:hypothetical protein RRG08_051047 [Elysia crispata]|uniref:Uncharacterized protein n=1 Tax=Elysia crispata TaxID=231223 RepID=A0AAE0Z513_9GAST|nr:hypothetical protein RRG08_051047 [Elysia crispata]
MEISFSSGVQGSVSGLGRARLQRETWAQRQQMSRQLFSQATRAKQHTVFSTGWNYRKCNLNDDDNDTDTNYI